MVQAGAANRRSLGSTSTGGCTSRPNQRAPATSGILTRSAARCRADLAGLTGWVSAERDGLGSARRRNRPSPCPRTDRFRARARWPRARRLRAVLLGSSVPYSHPRVGSSGYPVLLPPRLPLVGTDGRTRTVTVRYSGNSEGQPTPGGDHVSLVHSGAAVPSATEALVTPTRRSGRRSPPSASPAPWRTSWSPRRPPASTAWRSSSPTSWCPRCPPPRSGRGATTWACRSICTSRSATSTPCTRRRCERNLRRADRKFDVMEQLGTDLVLVCSANYPDAVDDDEQIAEQLHRLADPGRRSAACGSPTRRWPGRPTSTPTSGPGTSCGPPTTRRSGCASTASTSCPADRIRPGSRTSPARSCSSCSWPMPRRWTWTCCSGAGTTGCSPGQGAFDLPAFLGHVLAAGYTGPLSLEVFNDVFRQSDPGRAAVDAHRSLLALHEADRWPAARRDRRARSPIGGAAPPPTLGGFAFAELAVDDDSSPAVESTLTALGFHPLRAAPQQAGAALVAGRRQGAVERRPAGWTSTRPAPRWPPSAWRPPIPPGPPSGRRRCSLPCCPAAADRRRPTCPPLRRRTRPRCSSAAPVPTTRPAGSPTSRRRSESNGSAGSSALGITHIDHIALTQPFDRFDEAALFYRTVLGLQTQHSSEIAAPFGLVRNRAVANPDGTVRVCLSVSVLRRGSEWQPGVTDPQHVAFATDDIFAAARAATAAGAPIVAGAGQLLRRPGCPACAASRAARGHAGAERAARSERRRASSCTSTPRCSAVGSSSRWCSGSAGTPATGS